tara:strand:- start:1805 stop:2923 length:1119 start_codon:yes stop_codon:yes gene_type:complete
MNVGEFLKLISKVYAERGGIEGQRPALRTKTAKTIRARMVEDLSKGAIIPPVVIGIHCPADGVHALKNAKSGEQLIDAIRKIDTSALSIIDGMQRTTAILEAQNADQNISQREMRVEFWISENLNSLIYRMLVLNTGQVPWEIQRQLETIYSQLLTLVKKRIGDKAELYTRDDRSRRSDAGQYQASTIVRLYLAFSSRRAEFDIKDRVAEDFARLDAIEASSQADFVDYFTRTFEVLVKLDKAFSRATAAPKPHTTRIAEGKEVFKAEPALIGFFVAVAIEVFDEPGFPTSWEEVEPKMHLIEKNMDDFIKRLNTLTPDEVSEFLELETLNERLAQRSGQVGRFERDLFVRAFRRLIEKSENLPNMEPCWLR